MLSNFVKNTNLKFKKLNSSKIIRTIEAIIEIIFRLFSIYLVYLIFNWLITTVLVKDASNDTLLSLLLLPALYVLRDCGQIIDPCTVEVLQYEDRITVKRGLHPRVNDTLEFVHVENIEIMTTLLGKYFDYATVILYSPGGNVEMPYIKGAEEIVKEIRDKKQELKISDSLQSSNLSFKDTIAETKTKNILFA
ncbi:hypothetical protein CRV07_05110 [Halarcobacter ebronensis]|uniref:YdbS-like PH domain-containing protein n=1 Tax=Halarcobacter ebronensis TaxID=1462615 RepID=A0A4Q1AQ37_9BACT|nr:hypothetical protein CRV07_05110 [Halarcobacter ebronensis]